MGLLAGAPLSLVDLVDGLRSRVVDLCGHGGLANGPAALVHELYEELALFVRHF